MLVKILHFNTKTKKLVRVINNVHKKNTLTDCQFIPIKEKLLRNVPNIEHCVGEPFCKLLLARKVSDKKVPRDAIVLLKVLIKEP